MNGIMAVFEAGVHRLAALCMLSFALEMLLTEKAKKTGVRFLISLCAMATILGAIINFDWV